MTGVVVVGGNTETRLVLRGLLHLHHHRVVAEGGSADCIPRAEPDTGRPVVLLDVDVAEGSWSDVATQVATDHPGLPVVLVAPARSPRIESLARAAGVSTIVRRPFRVEELMAAIGSADQLSGAYRLEPPSPPLTSGPPRSPSREG